MTNDVSGRNALLYVRDRSSTLSRMNQVQLKPKIFTFVEKPLPLKCWEKVEVESNRILPLLNLCGKPTSVKKIRHKLL